MSTKSSAETLWVVLDANERVVLICGGAEAASVAAEWRDRGYLIRSLHAPEFHAA